MPDPATFAPLASNVTGKRLLETDVAGLEAACQDPAVVKAFLDDLVRVGRAAGLKGYEFPRALSLRMEPFSIEEGTIGVTAKMQVSRGKGERERGRRTRG